ncbi:MAG: DNA-directed RNA polymerase subunit alpha [Candidatus Ryanbacteria bacterium]|nr:DNA-directed RNA polymerase subunit alpha [Candidatus Ryanbacteria bacterium]
MNTTILLPSRPYVENETPTKADIIIEGLHPGYGVTIGNAMRRVLFSSLPGAAVTRIKIQSVNHEFSTIPGVLEDVLLIVLNLKQLRFKMYSEESETFLFEAKGECEVKAGDIKTSSNLEIINTDLHIATLTKKSALLSIEITVERGVGYRPKEVIESQRLEAGVIVLDAIFTPIRKVSYHVENMRVGTETDYNKLIMSIDTDGTITPRDAFTSALEILIGQLGELRVFGEKGEVLSVLPLHKEELVPVASNDDTDYGNILLEDVKLSSHTLNALARAGFTKLGDVARKTETELRDLDGVGEKAMQEIHRELGNFGLTLAQED